MKRTIKYLILFLVFANNIHSQNNVLDSLSSALITAKAKNLNDTVICDLMVDLSWELIFSNPDSAIRLTLRAKELVSKPNLKKHLGACYHALGWFYDVKAEYSKSLENYDQAMSIWNEISMVKGQAATLGNMGSVYANMGDLPKALDYYLKSQLICEQLGLKDEIAIGNNNIGLIYSEKKDDKKALVYFYKALEVFRKIKHENGIQSALSNIGVAYTNLKDQQKAIQYLGQALEITKRLGDKIGSSTNLGSIGLIYHDSDPEKALVYYQKALALAFETGDKGSIAIWQGNIGELYLNKMNYSESGKYLLSALSIFEESKDMEGQMQSHKQLSELYDKVGKTELALIHFKRYGAIKDTLFNTEKEKAITFREMNFEFDKKQSVTKSIHDKVMLEVDNQRKKQRLILLMAGIGIVLVILFFIFIFRSLQIAGRQRDVISGQKHLIEEKQKEVLDSIHYARRIQKALLPSDIYIDRNLRSLKH